MTGHRARDRHRCTRPRAARYGRAGERNHCRDAASQHLWLSEARTSVVSRSDCAAACPVLDAGRDTAELRKEVWGVGRGFHPLSSSGRQSKGWSSAWVAALPHQPWRASLEPRHADRASSARPPLTSQRLKEDEDRVKYHGKAVDDGTDGVRGSHRLGNQIEDCKAHDQEDDEPLDPRHVGLLIFPVFTAYYSNALPHVQAEASMLSSL